MRLISGGSIPPPNDPAWTLPGIENPPIQTQGLRTGSLSGREIRIRKEIIRKWIIRTKGKDPWSRIEPITRTPDTEAGTPAEVIIQTQTRKFPVATMT
jgi:hypothetical protein